MRTDHHAVHAVFVAAMVTSMAADVVLPPESAPTGFKTVIVIGRRAAWPP
jgi:hypothetical protein